MGKVSAKPLLTPRLGCQLAFLQARPATKTAAECEQSASQDSLHPRSSQVQIQIACANFYYRSEVAWLDRLSHYQYHLL